MRHILVMILAIINLNCVPGLSFLSPLHSSLRPSVQNNHFYRASRLPACWPAYWPTRPIVPCAAEDSSGEVSHFPADTSVGWKKEKEEDDVKLKDGIGRTTDGHGHCIRFLLYVLSSFQNHDGFFQYMIV